MSPQKSHRTFVHNSDLWHLLVSQVRYSLGRMSSSPSTTHDLIRSYGKALSVTQLLQLHDEIASEIKIAEDRYATVGMAIDHQVWIDCLATIVGQIDRRKDD